MGQRYERFVRSTVDVANEEIVRVQELADQLAEWIDQLDAAISLAHVHGAQSAAIQDLVGTALRSVGFVEEQVLTAQEGFSTRARPDFYFPLGDGRGIIAEVERGGAVNNNHDLKDMWKAHIAGEAQHLFIVVPYSNWREDGSPREKPFTRVLHATARSSANPDARSTSTPASCSATAPTASRPRHCRRSLGA